MSDIDGTATTLGGKSLGIDLYSTATSDTSQIEVESIAWAGASVHRSKLVDVDGDGRLDLVLKFRLQDTDLPTQYTEALRADQENSVQQLEIELTGNTLDGTDFSSLVGSHRGNDGQEIAGFTSFVLAIERVLMS